MASQVVAPFAGRTPIEDIDIDPNTGYIYYTARRSGRCTIIEYSPESRRLRDILPKEFSARTSVHEYGGAALRCTPYGWLIFTDFKTSSVCSLVPGTGSVKILLPGRLNTRYADFEPHPLCAEWMLAVRETHSNTTVNDLVVINCTQGTSTVIASNYDFYSSPRFSPDGKLVCFLSWNEPDMPWTGSLLSIADWLEKGAIQYPRIVSGKLKSESVSQPRWGLEGRELFFASDASGFYQLYKTWGGLANRLILPGLEDRDFSRPEWVLGCRTYVQLSQEVMVACCTSLATDAVVLINLRDWTHRTLDLPIVAVADNGLVKVSDKSFLVLGKSPRDPWTLYVVDVSDSQKPTYEALPRGDHDKTIQKDWISISSLLSIPRTHGAACGLIHAIFYSPKNPYYTGPSDALPPLILSFHGGPACHSTPALDPKVQFWTSRGFAVTELNYAGSSGYGRDYRDMLDGHWGEYEVDDAVSIVSYLAQESLIDGSRVGLTGKSAGGYAVLQALTRDPDLWAAGVSIAGVSDLTELMRTMHKFEKPYVARLISGEARCSNTELESIGKERSPFARAASVNFPLLLIHGTNDKVIGKGHSEKMRDAVVSAGGCVKLVLFDEGHSFRMPENIVAAKQEEENWWVKYLVTNEMQ
ncbi:uncharacterized protein N7496_005222 [Penicillium cataractarum]|uniref:Peptidase S9 prolyl oligopeptidase catalytic domain-containing protein n=1 Tax=Penicillium cataractarum TaxID=2100454 RepID=A0A9W9VD83_9EURO|nr:uncharacterized protein N7496_005222 [Penicillium cataractarum]KAJ5377813.1 hypothetical protein N7496_005222 [Penicillium cataractarum]